MNDNFKLALVAPHDHDHDHGPEDQGTGFFGAAIKGNSTHVVKKPEAETLHISHVCINNEKPTSGNTLLKVKINDKSYVIACLDDKKPMSKLDLFFQCDPKEKAEPVQFITEGNAKIDVTGYWQSEEPSEDEPMEGDEGEQQDEVLLHISEIDIQNDQKTINIIGINLIFTFDFLFVKETDEQFDARRAELEKERAEGKTKKDKGIFKHLFRSKGKPQNLKIRIIEK